MSWRCSIVPNTKFVYAFIICSLDRTQTHFFVFFLFLLTLDLDTVIWCWYMNFTCASWRCTVLAYQKVNLNFGHVWCGTRADVPYVFEFDGHTLANRSVLFDLDKSIADRVVERLDHINWFNRNFGVCVLELVLYTPYSDLVTQVTNSVTWNYY